MFSKILRRTHMYLALFLVPWVLMYTLSTMTMNHRDLLQRWYGEGMLRFEKESERAYDGRFADKAGPEQMAMQILSDLDMDGAFNVRRGEDGALIIQRHHPVTPRRLTFHPRDGRLLIERDVFRPHAFLERLHRRRGYQHDYALEDSWAFSVDLFVAGMVFWVMSGLWMWWEMRVTRGIGALCLAGGLALFAFFLARM